MKAEEEKDITVTFPEDYQAEGPGRPGSGVLHQGA